MKFIFYRKTEIWNLKTSIVSKEYGGPELLNYKTSTVSFLIPSTNCTYYGDSILILSRYKSIFTENVKNIQESLTLTKT